MWRIYENLRTKYAYFREFYQSNRRYFRPLILSARPLNSPDLPIKRNASQLSFSKDKDIHIHKDCKSVFLNTIS